MSYRSYRSFGPSKEILTVILLRLDGNTRGTILQVFYGMITAFKVRDLFVCVQSNTKVIVPGIEVYILHTYATPRANKPGFNNTCSRADK